MASSLSQATLKQYEQALKKWREFCLSYGGDFFDPKIDDLQNFLTKNFVAGASYGTINTLRSAVSLITKQKLGEHPLITRLMKGFYKIRPTAPKYQATWDVSVVLKYLKKKLYPLEELTAKELSERTATLLALSTAHRVQTLSSIKLENIRKTKEGLKILIPEHVKTSGPGRFQPVLNLPAFKKNPKICVVKSLKKYLGVTKNRRGNEKSLFISLNKPYKAVGAQTISKWIKNTL